MIPLMQMLLSGNGGASDPYWDNVVLLVPMNGADGSTSFTDASSSERAITSYGSGSYPQAAHDDGFAFTGATSGLFGGDGSASTVQSRIQAASSTDFDFGTGEFCIEWFMHWNSFSGYRTAIDRGYTSPGALLLQTGDGNGRFVIYTGGGGAASEISAPSLSTPYHYALARDADGDIWLYRGGVVTAGPVSAGSFNVSNAAAFGFGSAVSGQNYGLNAYAAWLRVTKGAGRYPNGVTFTPPSLPFPMG